MFFPAEKRKILKAMPKVLTRLRRRFKEDPKTATGLLMLSIVIFVCAPLLFPMAIELLLREWLCDISRCNPRVGENLGSNLPGGFSFLWD
jgi:hypothetical protein